MSDILKQLDGEFAKLKSDIESTQSKNMDEKLKAVNDAIEALKAAKPEVTADELKAIKADLDATIKALDIVQTRVKATGHAATEVKSFQEVLANEMDTVKDGLKDLQAGKIKNLSINLKAVADMTFANNFSTAASAVTTLKPGIIELPKRKLHIRELLPGGTMGGNTYHFVKETAGEGNIWTAAEGSLKPQIDLDLQEASVNAQWIAGFVVASRNMLEDVPGMATFLNSRLPELLFRAEDQQILTGNGSGANLSGIFTSGNSTTTTSTATSDVEQLIESIAQLEGYDREANGILINPLNYYKMLIQKASGSGEYDLPTALVSVVNGQLYIAGVPVFKSTAIASDKFVVGDWVMGANFISRDPVRVQFAYEDSDNFRRNKVTVRIEERVALPIYGDNYFVTGDFGSIAS